MDYNYIGWVPCVSGRLFYEYTHCGLGDSPRHHINHLEKDPTNDLYHRFILVSSVVDWKDSKDNDTTGKYRVIMMGHKTSDKINLVGIVAIYPFNLPDVYINKIEQLILRIKQSVTNEENIETQFVELKNLITNINIEQYYIVNFLLDSPGFLKLSYYEPEITEEISFTEEHKYTIMRQAYYYIKYTMHRHTHHHDKAESLTTIHSLTIQKNRIGIKLLNDLRKSLVQLKRDFKPYNCNSVYHASGISSYAQSLAESCYKEGYLEKDEYESEKSYFDNVKSSLEVMAGVVEKEIAKKTMVSGNARALILFTLSIIMPLVLIYKERISTYISTQDEKSIFIIDIIAKIVSSDRNIITSAFALFVFYYIYKTNHLNNGSWLLSLRRYRDTIEAIVYSKRKAMIILFVAMLISFILVGHSLFTIINS